MLEYPTEETLVQEVVLEEPSRFFPNESQELEDVGISIILIEELLLKTLLSKGSLMGRELADEICLPFKIVNPILADLKSKMLVVHRTTASMGDFYYALTDQGKQTAMIAKDYCAYVGPVPVAFSTYVESVLSQSIRHEAPKIGDLKNAYSDIIVTDDILNTIGPAINSGRGVFLFGEPGNGKTTLAERIRNCFKDDIFIPYSIWVEGEIIQLYDPQCHELVSMNSETSYDKRWLKIKRPTIVVGGELIMESLDIKYNTLFKTSEAPLQMKANGGTFLIDDFGRQRIDHRDLLNRWIIPLEKHYDYLNLPNGKKVQVPFDELIIFSTNLNPKDLVDDAFLRRIPYKIEIVNPSEEQFRTVFRYQCDKYGIPYEDAMVSYLIQKHYQGKRGFRVCHARDILDQIINASNYWGAEPRMTPELIDLACKNYFAAMECIV